MARPKCIVFDTKGKLEFMEEGITQEEWSHRFPGQELFYDIIGSCRTLEFNKVKKALNLAMSTWDLEIDVNFKPLWADRTNREADITVDFKTAAEDNLFRDRPGVLAYAYFPATTLQGVIVFNNDRIWSLGGKPITAQKALDEGWITEIENPDNMLTTYNIIHTLIHELGHTLGLRHDAQLGTQDVMDAFYNGKLELSVNDIKRILLKYSKRVYSRIGHYARLKKAFRRIKARLRI